MNNTEIHTAFFQINTALKWVIFVLFVVMWMVLTGVIVESVWGKDITLQEKAEEEALKIKQAEMRYEIALVKERVEQIMHDHYKHELEKKALDAFQSGHVQINQRFHDKLVTQRARKTAASNSFAK